MWLLFIVLCILKSTTINGETLWFLPWGNFLDELLNMLHIGNGALPAFTMGGIILSLIVTKYSNTKNANKIFFVVV